jgi:hypothetical protein
LRMPPARLRAAGVALALVAGLTATAVSAAAASGTGPAHDITARGGLGVAAIPAVPGTPAGGTATAAGQLPQSATVTLPTGDRVRLDVSPDGAQQVTPIPADTVHGKPAASSTFVEFTWGGDQYVVPDAAVPYLHSVLDPRLFDVSYLARAHLGTGGTGIPVKITYTGAAARASLPGVRVTRRSGATATAALSDTQAAGLGRLLAAQWRAARTGRSRTPVGRLPGITSISLARPPGAPPLPASPFSRAGTASSGLPFYTLTLHFTDLNGKPGTFLGFAQNVGDAALYTSGTTGSGTESLSVPKGTYSLMFSILTADSSGTGFDTALVVKPQVSVDSDTTVTLDARTAVPYRAAPATAVKASVRSDVIGFARASVTGGGTDNLGLAASQSLRLYAISPNPVPSLIADGLLATPTPPAAKGSLLFDAFTVLSNTLLGGSQGSDPMYILDFPHQGSIPSSLSYTVPTADLTTVHQQVYNPPSGCNSQGQDQVDTSVYLPLGGGQWFGPDAAVYVSAGDRTDYWYSSDPHLDRWQASVTPVGSSGSCFTLLLGAVQAIAPGRQITQVWYKAPLVPSPLAPSVSDLDGLGGGLTYCAACRQDDNGELNLLPFADSDPSHHSDGYPVADYSSSLSFYRNGSLALASSEFAGGFFPIGLELPMLSRAAAYELDWTESLAGTGEPVIDTDWAFRSGPGDPAAVLPASERCAPDTTRPCSLLPLLFVRYDLALNFSDQASAGTPEQITFTVTGQQNAPPPPTGLSATVSASFDGGHTWTTPQAATSLGNGQFTTTISQPALASTDGFVSLRVSASDGSGSGVTQTIIRAYGLTS